MTLYISNTAKDLWFCRAVQAVSGQAQCGATDSSAHESSRPRFIGAETHGRLPDPITIKRRYFTLATPTKWKASVQRLNDNDEMNISDLRSRGRRCDPIGTRVFGVLWRSLQLNG